MGNKFDCQCQSHKEKTFLLNNFKEYSDKEIKYEGTNFYQDHKDKCNPLIKEPVFFKSDCNNESEEVLDENSIQKPKIYHETKTVVNSLQKFNGKNVETTPSICNDERKDENEDIKEEPTFDKKVIRKSKCTSKGCDNQSRNIYRDIQETYTNSISTEMKIKPDNSKIKTLLSNNNNKLNIPNFSEYQFSRNKLNYVITCLDQLKKNKPKKLIDNEFVFLNDNMYKLENNQDDKFNLISIMCLLTKDFFKFQYLNSDQNKRNESNKSLLFIPLKEVKTVRVVQFVKNDKFGLEKPLYFFELITSSLYFKSPTDHHHINNFKNESIMKESSQLNSKFYNKMATTKRKSNILNGHLMREINIGLEANQKKATKEKSIEDNKIMYQEIRFESENQLADFLHFKNSSKGKLNLPTTIFPKSDNEKIDYTIKNKFLQENQAFECYDPCKINIFGIDNENKMLKWVILFNWILSLKSSNENQL